MMEGCRCKVHSDEPDGGGQGRLHRFEFKFRRRAEDLLIRLASRRFGVAVYQIVHLVHHRIPPTFRTSVRMAHRAARTRRSQVPMRNGRMRLHQQHDAEQEMGDDALSPHAGGKVQIRAGNG